MVFSDKRWFWTPQAWYLLDKSQEVCHAKHGQAKLDTLVKSFKKFSSKVPLLQTKMSLFIDNLDNKILKLWNSKIT
jgi:hypothetical protein